MITLAAISIAKACGYAIAFGAVCIFMALVLTPK